MAHQLPPVDDEVFEALQRLAQPLVDDVNSVLRRVLGLDRAQSVAATAHTEDSDSAHPRRLPRPLRTQRTPRRRGATNRAARGSLLPEKEYEIPLLVALANRGGSAPASDVIEDVGRALNSRLTDTDRETLNSGMVRWRNRVQFVRLKLVQAGQIKKDSPRGTWETTTAGHDRVKQDGAEA